MKDILRKIVDGKDLTETEIMNSMNYIMEGRATQVQIGSFITGLYMKGVTIDEITGCARIMRKKASTIRPKVDYCIDTCGTGGDNANTFNISTATSIITAACGVKVAKHGNRSVSSKCGSADVLEKLGINIFLTPNQVKMCIENIGIGFMFAPAFHKSMKYAAGPRKDLGLRTIFNILGPLTNPANANGQILGVFSSSLTESIAQVLNNLGVERAVVVHGEDGLDEITTTGETFVSEVVNGKVKNYKINPEKYGMKTASKRDLLGGVAEYNAEIIKAILDGEKGPKRDIVVLNTAAALYVGKKVENIKEGVKLAKNIIDSGIAKQKLNEFSEYTNELDR